MESNEIVPITFRQRKVVEKNCITILMLCTTVVESPNFKVPGYATDHIKIIQNFENY